MATTIKLVNEEGKIYSYRMHSADNNLTEANRTQHYFNRDVFAAAHVTVNPLPERKDETNYAFDWEATIKYRRYLWKLGFGVAEAMDTAQRGMGLNWQQSLALIQKSCAEAKRIPGSRIACGASTDHLEAGKIFSTDKIIEAYSYQIEEIQKAGGDIILMASRHICATAKSPKDYHYVYDKVLENANKPVIIHWLGDMFDPLLAGYWGAKDIDTAMNHCLEMIHRNQSRITGIKISLLDKHQEIKMRRQLPNRVKMLTGDDDNDPELIAGDEQGYSDALLGIFDAIAPIASNALNELGSGNTQFYHHLMEPTVPLARLIFKSPTRFYKTGIVFLAYLNNFQNHFIMISNDQTARSPSHFCKIFEEADRIGLLRYPETAAKRMKELMKLYGVG